MKIPCNFKRRGKVRLAGPWSAAPLSKKTTSQAGRRVGRAGHYTQVPS